MDQIRPPSPNDEYRANMLDRLSILSLQIAELAGEAAHDSEMVDPATTQTNCDIFSKMIRTYGLIERLRTMPQKPLSLNEARVFDETRTQAPNAVPAAAAPAEQREAVTQANAVEDKIVNPLSRMNSLPIDQPLRPPMPADGAGPIPGKPGKRAAKCLSNDLADVEVDWPWGEETMSAAQEKIHNLARAAAFNSSGHLSDASFHQQAEELLTCLDEMLLECDEGDPPP